MSRAGRARAALKDESELARMRLAGRVVARALAEMAAAARPGVTTRALDELAERVIRQHEAEAAFRGVPGPYPYPAATCISVNEQLVHGLPGPRILCEGDVVKLDCGVRYQGYHADGALTVGVGLCSPQAQRLMQATERALWAGIAQMRVGRRAGDVSAAIQAEVEAHGYSVVREFTSHGVGRKLHEAPYIPNHGQPGVGRRLEVGMTVAIEPMVLTGQPATRVLPDQWTVAAVDGRLTAHFEHTVAVTEGEPEILTRE